MTRRGFDDHAAIAKDIMILAVENDCFAVGETYEKFRIRYAAWIGRTRSEDRVTVTLLHDPSATCEQARIGDVIGVVVRERQIGDVGRRVADRGELREQRTIDREGA